MPRDYLPSLCRGVRYRMQTPRLATLRRPRYGSSREGGTVHASRARRERRWQLHRRKNGMLTNASVAETWGRWATHLKRHRSHLLARSSRYVGKSLIFEYLGFSLWFFSQSERHCPPVILAAHLGHRKNTFSISDGRRR